MRFQSLIFTAALGTALAMCAASTSGAQIVDFGKYPDFSGQWKRPPGVGIQYDQTKPFGRRQVAQMFPKVTDLDTQSDVRAEQAGQF